MDRRSFIRSIIVTGASCAILPSALTYARKWKTWESPTLFTRCVFQWHCVDQPLEIVSPKWHSVRELAVRLYPEYCLPLDGIYTPVNFRIVHEDKFAA